MLTRKHYILAKEETVDGQDSSPGPSDAVQSYEADTRFAPQLNTRRPATATLSPELDAINRTRATSNFQVDLRPGDTITEEPEFGRFLRACGYRQQDVVLLDGGTVVGTFLPGELVTQATSGAQGICIDRYTAGGSFIKVFSLSTQATWGTQAITGAISGATITPSSGATTTGVGMGWMPTSTRAHRFTLTGAVGGSTVAGDVLRFETGGTVHGYGVFLGAHYTGANTYLVSMQWGDAQNGDTATNVTRTTTAGTCANPVNFLPTWMTSLTLKDWLDGVTSKVLGGRGNGTLLLSAGETCYWSFAFQGGPGTVADEGAIVPAPAVTTALPYRAASASLRLYDSTNPSNVVIARSAELDLGNAIADRLDINAANGVIGAFISAREPVLRVSIEGHAMAQMAWLTKLTTGASVRFHAKLGTSPAVSLWALNCQVASFAPGDADGVVMYDLELRPKRTNAQGDDELGIAIL